MHEVQEPLDRRWYKDAVVYQIHVRSFYDGTADGLGDFAGLRRKLDYLQELGITCLWLQPFFPSPLRDDGYDIADFRGIHPAYGDMEDFRRFLDDAQRRGLRVLAELVLGHTSDQHPWFQAARRAPPGSALRQFYVWNDVDPAPTDRRWAWDSLAQASYRHRYFDHEPDLNWAHPPVRREMLAILRFWLDLGLDGLCLSALASPRGEGREARDEGQAILADICADVERDHPGRVLLARERGARGEGRGTSEDASPLAPRLSPLVPLVLHDSLMPRLCLALGQEDRYPIIDMMKKAPSLPAACQWAMFLRNHDELELGLMSDEERDDLVKEYAADPHMRRASGILRRLAPLMDNSRPRIELMFGLLLSLSGTPIIYYGDEIGMGDNVYLGDRQAVRTPMQWTGGPNAGFSEADAARLFAPPNSDPVYGYPIVNVEAQERDHSSLLHRMQRLLAARRRLPVLGRGTLEFLAVPNRKVLAYVRIDNNGDDVFLAVANLAPTGQPAEIDLAAFAERIPVEVFGQTDFPPIGSDPYFFTLGPFEFFWFQLQRKVETIALRRLPVSIEEIKEAPRLTTSGKWRDLLEGAEWTRLAQTLPGFLQSQRWFGAKARPVQSIRVADWAELPFGAACRHGPDVAISQCAAVFAMLEIGFVDGAAETYALPLEAVASTEAARRLPALRGRVLARLSGPHGEHVLIDAFADGAFSEALIDAIGAGQQFPTRFGRLRSAPTTMFTSLRGERETPLRATPGSATSSNSLVLYGRRLLLKVFRHPDVGINPDVEVGRFLTERTAFGAVPRLAGALEYQPAAGKGNTVTLAMLQQLVTNQGDGWQHAIDELGRYFQRALARPTAENPSDRCAWLELADRDPPPDVLEAIGPYLQAAQTLGKRSAELHLALASGEGDPAFAPEPLTPADLTLWASEAGAEAERILRTLRQHLDRLGDKLRPQAERLLADGPRLAAQLRAVSATKIEAAKIRCHGDFHLGQVLRRDGDFVIIDFEGEPAHTIAQRRAKHSPLKDVAGMLRSFSYAAYAGLFAFTQHRPGDFEPLNPWAELWQAWTAAVFLKAYRAAAGAAPFLPRDPAAFSTLLRFFLLDKALYELIYELNNRPDWMPIPMQGIMALLGSERTRHATASRAS